MDSSVKLEVLPQNIARYDVSTSEEVDHLVSDIRALQARADSSVEDSVSKIVLDVRKRGDEALLEFTRKFDFSGISDANQLKVHRSEIEQAYSKVDKSELRALKIAARQIAFLSKEQLKRFGPKTLRTPLGFEIQENYIPFSRIGGYVPGGLAAYPSSVLMISIPARTAGVKEIVLCTPARKDGTVSEQVLVAADLCGVSELFKVGGAQAVAALAYGTRMISNVQLIAGPGNAYVAEAKRQAASSGHLLIDTIAGPTELLIVADKTASPKLIAEDLISQAEHGNKTICGLLTDSKEILDSTIKILSSEVGSRPRAEQIGACILFGALVPSTSFMIEFAQKFAPEHLELMVKNSKPYEKILRASSGLLLIGDYTPCSSTDYIVGTNHILPTGGTAASTPGLGVERFLKRSTIVKGSRSSLSKASKLIEALANSEGLPNHGAAARARFPKSKGAK